MSHFGEADTRSASEVRKVFGMATLILCAPSTTWRAVTTTWGDSRKKPVPKCAAFLFLASIMTVPAWTFFTTEEKPFEEGTPVLMVTWFEDDEIRERMTLSKAGDEKSAEYYAESGATRHLPTEVSRTYASQIEDDLETVLR